MKVCFPLIKAGSGTDFWIIHLSNALRNLGVETVIYWYPHKYQFFPYLLKIRKKEMEADIIHTNSWNGFIFKRDIPLLVTEHLVVHDQILNKYKNLPQKIFHKLVYKFEKESFSVADQITCVSDYTSNKLKEVFGVDSIKIYNAVDIKKFFPKKIKNNFRIIERSKTILLFVGNMTKRKGADLLSEIMRRLGDKFVLICTSGARKSVIRVNANMHIIGNLSQEELIDYYNYCDVFVFPSRLEGLSFAVIEAMACGKPVVATNCSSMPELIVDGKGGFLCEMDNVNEFTEKIQALAENKALRKEMGRFNRERVEKYFSLERMAKDYYALYQKIIKG